MRCPTNVPNVTAVVEGPDQIKAWESKDPIKSRHGSRSRETEQNKRKVDRMKIDVLYFKSGDIHPNYLYFDASLQMK